MSAPTDETLAAPAGAPAPHDGAAAPAASGPDAGTHRPRPRRRARVGLARWSLRGILQATGAVVAVLLVAVVVVGTVALSELSDRRVALIDGIDPALIAAQQLDAATVDQETGVRGYALGARPDFLEPYLRGRADEARLVTRLRELEAPYPEAIAELDAVGAAADRWRAVYAEPVVDAVGRGVPLPPPDVGRVAFEQLRSAQATQTGRLLALRAEARDGLDDAARMLLVAGIVTVVVLAVGIGALLWWLRRVVVLPARRLAGEVRQVVVGDLDRHVEVVGPREITELAEDVDAMRVLIVQELARSEADRRELDTRSEELARSNSDLEQFAYVASHDLQEPLRKVASFTQLLQRRYSGELDERADQYIEFAVDGAKRMQVLINDLLAFSRVGRQGGVAELVDLGDLVDRAVENVAGALEESGGAVERGPLPRVMGERALLTTVFQNLLGNSLKFRGEDPPRVRVEAERDGDRWLLRFSDNGIGIDPEYGERIFVIFQRLHAKSTYPGTGIGLAMCRKIVEHHGGTMWLEERSGPGTVFVVALPVDPGATDAGEASAAPGPSDAGPFDADPAAPAPSDTGPSDPGTPGPSTSETRSPDAQEIAP